MNNINRILISGTGSGCGKTTISCAILKALINRNITVQPYKCGPDYIDTMFHTHITSRISRNLDSYMLDDITIRWLMKKNSYNADISLIEGVMGYYDGIGIDGNCSTYDIANITQTPVVIVLNSKGMATSVAALVKGYRDFKINSNIKGVILNGIHEGYYNIQKEVIEKNTDIKVFGYMPTINEISLESRHLGLITVSEIKEFDYKLKLLSEQAEETIDIDGLLELSKSSEEFIAYEPIYINNITKKEDFKIGIAKDKAFCFYYQDNIDLLKDLGAEIIEFSPIHDKVLPIGIDGLYIGGGYPEIYANMLEKNISMKTSIYDAVSKGMPTIAECGGFMYLCNKINTINGDSYNMVGIIDGTINMTNKLVRFGYSEITSLSDNLLSKKGWKIKAHEFHYSDSTVNGKDFIIEKPSGKSWFAINANENLYAGYPHINFWSNVDFIIRFCDKITHRKQIILFKKEDIYN